jgi:hypothetical protein
MNRGFIALTLVLIVSTMTLVFLSYKYLSIGYFFDSTVRKEYRLNSYYNALSCADQAILNLTKDYFYRSNTPVKVEYFNCHIDSVIDNGGYIEIRTHGEVGGVVVRILTKVSLYSYGVDKI